MKEILERLDLLNGRAIHDGVPTNAFDIEKMKLLLETLCIDSGVEIRLYTFLAGAVCSGSRLTHAITESKSGRQAFSGKVFIDCTGDGDLAARAGCGFDMGHPETGAMQPMTLLALVAGIDPEAVRPFFRYAGETPKVEVCQRLRKEMERGGHSSSHAMPGLFWICEDLFGLAANHEYGVRGTDTVDLTHATLDARKEIHSLVNALRGLGGVWGRLHLVATASQIGVREGRRIHGQYMITIDDMTKGVRHPDAVCTVTFPIDVHATDPATGKTFLNDPSSLQKIQPYDIPLRALIARDVDGLMMAGRCISGDFLAHASYRVTGNAVAMGEAAGRVAARTASGGCLPNEEILTQERSCI